MLTDYSIHEDEVKALHRSVIGAIAGDTDIACVSHVLHRGV